MIVGILFLSARAVELFFLIPIIGMLSYLVDGYVKANQLTPTYVLVLFIVSTIAGVWALFTMLFYGAAKHNGYFLWFVDLCIFGGLIAGVYLLGGISTTDCDSVTLEFARNNAIYKSIGYWINDWSPKVCSLLKASFALGIMEVIFFFWTSFLALWVHHHHRKDYEDRSRRSERHYSRHSHRRGGGSSSRSRAGGGAADSYYSDSRRRGGSRTRSQYRSTRSYV